MKQGKRQVKLSTNVAMLERRTEEFTLPDGTVIRRGDAVSVRGVAGQWRLSYVWDGQPVFYGGEIGYGHLRSFRVELLGQPKVRRKRNLTDEQRQALRDRMAQVRSSRGKKVA